MTARKQPAAPKRKAVTLAECRRIARPVGLYVEHEPPSPSFPTHIYTANAVGVDASAQAEHSSRAVALRMLRAALLEMRGEK